MSLKESLVRFSPYFIQNLAVTLFNVYQYRIRHGGDYKYFREFYENAESLNQDELDQAIQLNKIFCLTLKTLLSGIKIKN